jgi:O-antigen biosynthesis protein
MKLSISTPVLNNWNFTKAYLKDLAKLNDCEVILVDNNSTDDTVKLHNLETSGLIKGVDYPEKLKVIINKENLGFAKASNQGYQASSGDYILFLNNDIRVQKDHSNWVDKLIEAADDNSLVGPTMGLLDSSFKFVKEENKYLEGLSYLSGWCLLGSRKVFENLDLSNGEIFSQEYVSYFEDADLSFRCKKQNINLKVINVPVVHFGRMTGKKLNLIEIYSKSRSTFLNKWIGDI